MMIYLFTKINGEKKLVDSLEEVIPLLNDDFLGADIPLHSYLKLSSVRNLLHHFGLKANHFRLGVSWLEFQDGSSVVNPSLVYDENHSNLHQYIPTVILTNVETAENGEDAVKYLNKAISGDIISIDLSYYTTQNELMKIVVASLNKLSLVHFYVYDEDVFNLLYDLLDNKVLTLFTGYTLKTYNYDEAIEGFGVETTLSGVALTSECTTDKQVYESFEPYEE